MVAPNTDPDLPVVGEEVWTSADGRAATVRIAVHAVRRIPDGTVLDWSVTPVSAPGLTSTALPAALDLGLSAGSRPAIALLDGDAGTVYRPLQGRRRPLPVLVGGSGHRRLAHRRDPTAAGRLSAVAARSGRSSTSTSPPCRSSTGCRSPREGMVPLATSPSDLSRPADLPAPYLAGAGFRYPDDSGQLLVVEPYRVVAGSFSTSLVWRIQAVGAGPGLDRASQPPLADGDRQITGNRIVASGPVLRVGGQRMSARLVTDRAAAAGAVTCLCTDLRDWAQGLRHAGQIATMVTTFPALPRGQSEVMVDFVGQGERRADVSRRWTPVRGPPARSRSRAPSGGGPRPASRRAGPTGTGRHRSRSRSCSPALCPPSTCWCADRRQAPKQHPDRSHDSGARPHECPTYAPGGRAIRTGR